ncbi:MAG TPA: alkaline phosphatase family protein [Acidimicrobiales bacterium]|nr:alkaline phosphatase family protein [Acidimicrobiales bacterium]
MPGPSISRRGFIAGGLTVGAGALLDTFGGSSLVGRAAATTPAGSDLGAVEHVVMLMLENRSFDHYFGVYPGVRGFNDHPAGSLGVFSQSWPQASSQPAHADTLVPYHLDVATTMAQCAGNSDIPVHGWVPQHHSWNGGKMDSFVSVHAQAGNDGPAQAPIVMGYLDGTDMPFRYALADAFTIGDSYHCSVIGPTMPNRLMWLTGTLDPAGAHGGPVLSTPSISQSPEAVGSCTWETVPELLEDKGVSWKVYQPLNGSVGSLQKDNLAIGFNALLYFKQLLKAGTPLYNKAFLPVWPDEFFADARNDTLPQVSWITPSIVDSEHPSAAPLNGEFMISQVLSALTANPKVWAKTVLVVSYDENGGFFDHVPPPVAPKGTKGEYVTARPLPASAGGIAGPIGLGFRVPLLVVSPFSRGGYVNSDRFDHTSQLRLLEERFGIKVSNISAWRRKTVGDLTSTLNVTGKPTTSVPPMPATAQGGAVVSAECPDNQNPASLLGPAPTLTIPATLSMPTQQPGKAKRLKV